MLGLVLTSDGFKAGEIVAATENPEACRVNLSHSDMKMRPSALHMSDDEARATSADPELGVDRSDKGRQLCGRHRALGRDRKVADAITAAFRRCERMTNSHLARERSAPAAFLGGGVIGTLGGRLIGLGGAEFRLPLLTACSASLRWRQSY